MSNIDLGECLNCNLPVSCCVGEPRKCRLKYERYLAVKEATKTKAQGAPANKNILEGNTKNEKH